MAGRSPSGSRVTGPGPAAPAAALAARLEAIHGIHGVVVLRADPTLTIPGTFHDLGVNAFGDNPGGSVPPIPADVASCAQLATVPVLGRCPAGATPAAIPPAIFGPNAFFGNQDASGFTWPGANVPAARLDALRG